MTTAREFFNGLWDVLTGHHDQHGHCEQCRACIADFKCGACGHVQVDPYGLLARLKLAERVSSEAICVVCKHPEHRKNDRIVACSACHSGQSSLPSGTMCQVVAVFCVLHGYAAGDHASCVINHGPYCGEPVTNGQIEEGDAYPIDERGPNDGEYEHAWCVQGSER